MSHRTCARASRDGRSKTDVAGVDDDKPHRPSGGRDVDRGSRISERGGGEVEKSSSTYYTPVGEVGGVGGGVGWGEGGGEVCEGLEGGVGWKRAERMRGSRHHSHPDRSGERDDRDTHRERRSGGGDNGSRCNGSGRHRGDFDSDEEGWRRRWVAGRGREDEDMEEEKEQHRERRRGERRDKRKGEKSNKEERFDYDVDRDYNNITYMLHKQTRHMDKYLSSIERRVRGLETVLGECLAILRATTNPSSLTSSTSSTSSSSSTSRHCAATSADAHTNITGTGTIITDSPPPPPPPRNDEDHNNNLAGEVHIDSRRDSRRISRVGVDNSTFHGDRIVPVSVGGGGGGVVVVGHHHTNIVGVRKDQSPETSTVTSVTADSLVTGHSGTAGVAEGRHGEMEEGFVCPTREAMMQHDRNTGSAAVVDVSLAHSSETTAILGGTRKIVTLKYTPPENQSHVKNMVDLEIDDIVCVTQQPDTTENGWRYVYKPTDPHSRGWYPGSYLGDIPPDRSS
eukprot:GHVQ01009746.1.p1 GENE.GHVQ01009746.1~~GHVQ01009746.1.p1  ORF type:complete len:510 (+),score=169.02 GHVQ01009746.1:624-2153(+)